MPANRLFPVITVVATLSVLIPACSQHSDKQQLATINEGLTRSLAFIQNNTDIEYRLLQNRLYDPQTRYWAQQWSRPALQNRARTIQVIGYIDTLVAKLTLSQYLATTTTRALFDTLLHFKHSLVTVFPDSFLAENQDRKEDWEKYCRHFPLLSALSDTIFQESHFNAWADTTVDKDALITLLALNNLKIDIALSAQMIARYCKWQTEPPGDHITIFQPLISLKSDVVQPGEIVEIKAGIGSYSTKVESRITIAGSPIPLNASTFAEYRFKAPRQPGKHSIPIKLEYTKPDGTIAWFNKVVFYYVSPLHQ